MDNDFYRELGYKIIGAAYEVRNQLGRFLYEDVYEQALQAELRLQGIHCERQVYLPVLYKGLKLDKSFRIDLLVENTIPIELKTVSSMGTAEFNQIMTYLTFGDFQLGYLINFAAENFRASSIPADMELTKGIYRVIRTKE